MGSSASIVNDDLRVRPKNLKSIGFSMQSINKNSYSLGTKIWRSRGFKHGIIKTVEWFTDPSNLKMYKANLYNI